MEWLQLNLPTTRNNVDAFSDILLDAGALSITLDGDKQQAIFELQPGHTPDLWEKLNLIALFTADTDPLAILQYLAEHLDSDLLMQAKWQRIGEEDWLDKWKEDLKPMLFGDRLWVCPSWCELPDPSAINISLDPEQAFGTGSHPTTAMCLDWIATKLEAGSTVIDYGCGSGILAIAAAKLGAVKVYGVDIDPISLEVTNTNAIKNNIPAEKILTYLPEEMPSVKVDVVIANILANPLIELAPTLAALLKSGGKLVLSGILAEQASKVQDHYAQWFENFEIQQQAEWIRISANLT